MNLEFDTVEEPRTERRREDHHSNEFYRSSLFTLGPKGPLALSRRFHMHVCFSSSATRRQLALRSSRRPQPTNFISEPAQWLHFPSCLFNSRDALVENSEGEPLQFQQRK